MTSAEGLHSLFMPLHDQLPSASSPPIPRDPLASCPMHDNADVEADCNPPRCKVNRRVDKLCAKLRR